MRRALLVLVAALLPTFACALPSMQERSPFAQGLWWDPARPGSGFDVFNAAGNAMVIWYTYDSAGKPVWYTAQGTTDTLGTDWPLLKFKWNGNAATSTQVGTLRFAPDTAESAKLTWNIAGSSSTVSVAPFIQSGMVNETDLTGTWFDPGRPGWGLSMLDQGEVMGAAMYLYTPAGEPTWVAGFNRSTTIDLYASTGSCPACEYRTPTSQKVGTLAFDYQGDARMTLRPQVSLAVAPGLAIDGAKVVQLGRPASIRGADRGLAQFDAASLKTFMVNGVRNVPPQLGADFSPAPATAAVTFSTTNLQEAGVDEAGLVKTDGSRIYAYKHDAYGTRTPVIRVVDVGAEGASAAPAGTVALSGDAVPVQSAGLVLYGDKLVSIHGGQVSMGNFGLPYVSGTQWTGGRSIVEVFDTTGALPTSRWKLEFEGYLITTRRIGPMLYVVSRFTPSLPGYSYYSGSAAQQQANEVALANATLAQLLPSAHFPSGGNGPLVSPDQVYAPPLGTRKITADLTTVTAIDLDRLAIAGSVSIAGSIETVYASAGYLVLASSRWDTHSTTSGTYLPEPPFSRTDVHMIRLAANGMGLVGSASVEGSISGAGGDKASFRLSESQGRLRVVTSSASFQWGPTSINRLTILEPSTVTAGLLKTLSWLPNAQRPESLGKPQELIYGTRFAGDRLYAVTFKKIDPLYVVDLANASDPRIAGSLQMPGFSDYLHPLADGLLLGFGKDAIPASVGADFGQFAWYQGLQVVLYDVSNAASPAEKQRIVIGKRGSNSALLDHHHAFSELQLAPGRLAFAIPASVNDGDAVNSGIFGDPNSAYYGWKYSGLLRFELQGTTAADMRIVPQSTLLTDKALSSNASPPYPDPGSRDGRSVLFSRGVVYGGYGKFWHMDTAGNVTGPF